MPLHLKIINFWEWFITSEQQIKAYFGEDAPVDKKSLIDSIDNHVLEFGLFSWEIGPAPKDKFYFTISPNAHKERLELSKTIMRLAPDLEGWVFHCAKPVKDWDLTFQVFDNFMIQQSIDANTWNCALSRNNYTIDIFFEIENIQQLDLDTQWTAADLVLTNMIGEEWKINFVNKIKIFDEFEEEYKAISFPIHMLQQKCKELLLSFTK